MTCFKKKIDHDIKHHKNNAAGITGIIDILVCISVKLGIEFTAITLISV